MLCNFFTIDVFTYLYRFSITVVVVVYVENEFIVKNINICRVICSQNRENIQLICKKKHFKLNNIVKENKICI